MPVTFKYKTASEEQSAMMKEFNAKFEELYKEIQLKILIGRGKSIALTKIEEASMWINKRIMEND